MQNMTKLKWLKPPGFVGSNNPNDATFSALKKLRMMS